MHFSCYCKVTTCVKRNCYNKPSIAKHSLERDYLFVINIESYYCLVFITYYIYIIFYCNREYNCYWLFRIDCWYVSYCFDCDSSRYDIIIYWLIRCNYAYLFIRIFPNYAYREFLLLLSSYADCLSACLLIRRDSIDLTKRNWLSSPFDALSYANCAANFSFCDWVKRLLVDCWSINARLRLSSAVCNISVAYFSFCYFNSLLFSDVTIFYCNILAYD